jgi:hypothetical protein
MRFFLIGFIIAFNLFYPVYGSDRDENGIDDRYDVIINPLPTPVMRVAARQLVYSLEELEVQSEYLPLNNELMLILALNHVIANECFEHARLSSNSTINNNLLWSSIYQVAATDETRHKLEKVISSFDRDIIHNAPPEYESTYERLSPFKGDFSGCDHLN